MCASFPHHGLSLFPSDVLSRGWYFMATAVPASSTTVLLEINSAEL